MLALTQGASGTPWTPTQDSLTGSLLDDTAQFTQPRGLTNTRTAKDPVDCSPCSTSTVVPSHKHASDVDDKAAPPCTTGRKKISK